jgi:hypothetical protein
MTVQLTPERVCFFVTKENMSHIEYCNEYAALLICIIGKEIGQKNKENSVLH